MADIQDIASRTIGEIALAYRSGQADPVAVTECLLERIRTSGHDNVFISVSGDRARGEAERSWTRFRQGRPLSPLDGVPLAWKDNCDVAGTRTTAASALLRDSAPKDRDAPCVANVAAAGMVCLGKLNMSEFAYSGLGLNPHFGTPRNPNDAAVARAPGGSSSGTGVAVAARLVPCGIGTDTGGSIRVPASFNGVVGFKTSERRIEKAGVFPLSHTLDTVGPLARSVADCALIDMALRGAVSVEARRGDLGALRIVVPTDVVLDDLEPAVAANFDRALAALEAAGATVVRRSVPAVVGAHALTAAWGTLTAAEAYHEHRGLVESDDVARMDRRVVKRIMDGRAMSADAVIAIQRGRIALEAEIGEILGGGALLAMPTTPITAPAIAPLEADDATFHRVNLFALRNVVIGNILGMCGLAMPSGRNENGMPTSILFSAMRGQDVRLLSHGLEIERVLAEAGAAA
ncbi:2-amino-5-chloromuconic acid deaminase [Aquamicrobium terrae]